MSDGTALALGENGQEIRDDLYTLTGTGCRTRLE